MNFVVKCGGTVLHNNSDILKFARYIKESFYKPEEGMQLIIVVGALQNKTDEREDEAISLARRPDERELDVLLATEEMANAARMAMALNDIGIPAVSLSGTQTGIHTTSEHNQARVKEVDLTRIRNELAEGKVVVVTGYQGGDSEGNITTFDVSYGGSDLSAVLLAGALGWECILYKDVDGIYSVDPDIFPRARKIPVLDYSAAAQFTAVTDTAVVEPYAIEMAYKFNTNIYVTSIENKDYRNGTLITKYAPEDNTSAITNLAFQHNLCLFTVFGEMSSDENVRIFERVSEDGVSVDVAIIEAFGNESALSLSCAQGDSEKLEKIFNEIAGNKLKVSKNEYVSVLAISGNGIATANDVIARIVKALNISNIPYHHVTSSETCIMVIMDSINIINAIVAISTEFEL